MSVILDRPSCLGFLRRGDDTWTGLETTTNLTELDFFFYLNVLLFHKLFTFTLFLLYEWTGLETSTNLTEPDFSFTNNMWGPHIVGCLFS